MNEQSNFKRIKHNDIDTDKWNECIANAVNGNIYACDWHLDRTAINWDALVWGDYEYVMPLTYRRKFGIKYVYPPLFSQQLGIFPSPPQKVLLAFYKYLLQNFSYGDITLNTANTPVQELAALRFIPRNNYILSLANSFEEIKTGFSKNTKRNIAKAQKFELSLIRGIGIQEYIDFKTSTATADVNTDALGKLRNLMALGTRKGFGRIYGVYTAQNQLCAAVYFCHYKNRVTYLNAASNEEGKAQRAMYFLLDKFIETHAGKELILDFEGSMHPGIARFYNGFGARIETYYQIKFNRLPYPLKWFKR